MASASCGHDMSRKIHEKGNDKIFKSFSSCNVESQYYLKWQTSIWFCIDLSPGGFVVLPFSVRCGAMKKAAYDLKRVVDDWRVKKN